MARHIKKTYDYFKLTFQNDDWKKNDYKFLDQYFENTLQVLNRPDNNDVDFVQINDDLHIGINKLEKFTHENKHVWIMCLSKVDTTKYAILSKVTEKVNTGREEYGEDPDQGLTVDTVLLICPRTGLVVIPRNKGGISERNLNDFLNLELATTGSTLSVIINGTKIKNLQHIDNIKEVQINVVRSVDPHQFRNRRNSRKKDDNIMDFLGGDKMNLVMKSTNLKKDSIIRYFRNLKFSKKNEMKKFVVVGTNDGHEQIIDLITNRLIYFDNAVELNENNKLTIDSMFKSIKKAYLDNKRIIYLDIFGDDENG